MPNYFATRTPGSSCSYDFPLQLATLLTCFSKITLKTQVTIPPGKANFLKYLAKQVLYFKKLFSKEINHKSITTPKESANKQKFQAQGVITAITFCFIFCQQLQHLLFLTVRTKKRLVISNSYWTFHNTGFKLRINWQITQNSSI